MCARLRSRHNLRLDPLRDAGATALRVAAARADVPLEALSVLLELRKHEKEGARPTAANGGASLPPDATIHDDDHSAAPSSSSSSSSVAAAASDAAANGGVSASPVGGSGGALVGRGRGVAEQLLHECLAASNLNAARALLTQLRADGTARHSLSPPTCDRVEVEVATRRHLGCPHSR